MTRRFALSAGCIAFAVVLAGCGGTPQGRDRSDGSTVPVATATSSGRPSSDASRPPATPASTKPSRRPVAAAPNPCARNAAEQQVRVSLARQHLWMCQRHRLVRDTPITSGIVGQYTSTPTGHYRIQGRNRNTTLTLAGGQQFEVRFWIPFDAPLFGFHDSPWQTFPYGSPRYRTDGSHGCVHMPRAAIAFLYRWVDIGARVVIA